MATGASKGFGRLVVGVVTVAIVVFSLAIGPVAASPYTDPVSLTWDFDSGFDDLQGNPLAASITMAQRYPDSPEAGFFAPLINKAILTEPTDGLPPDADPGTAEAFGVVRVVNGYTNYPLGFRAFASGANRVIQSNPNNTAARPARLELGFDLTITDPTAVNPQNRPNLPLIMPLFIRGVVGSGDGAYVQFETTQTMTSLDAQGNTIDTITETLGGDKPLTEAAYFDGAGRIDQSVVDANGGQQIDLLRIFNIGGLQDNPYYVGDEDVTRRPKLLSMSPDVAAVRFHGYFAFEAKNDGSPSGIFAANSESDLVIPEPTSVALLLGTLPLMLRRSARASRAA